ncbi:LacI family transcriptional regulator [Cohaesibacter sp. ES.047]|uniref:LacI family DNA-binding transcriptional regulator n=1 Tax=Cohaesibacter sp. ES.047 TaxID=1798205 RepID=UPI000BB793C9|nr:LacI family DNA-binding transcriptional regulator [Cohaesibacter sp. ES.047]SNY92206.1 LacI family transcriptional regulator [Cohaesibacter sp. ES.047]
MVQPPNRPTLKTLAELTGLSQSTVSLALRGGKNLKTETRDRVLKTAKEIGYVPDRAGVRLRTGRTNSIGLILDGREDSIGFTRYLMHGISTEAHKSNFNVNVYPQFSRAESEETMLRLVRSGLVDGIILTHTEPQDRRVKLLLEMDFPFVTHGRTELFTEHAYHDFNSEKFIDLAFEIFTARKVKNLLAILSDSYTTNNSLVKRLFEDHCKQMEINGEVFEYSHGAEGHIATLRSMSMSILDQQAPVDGILCENELDAISVATGLRDTEYPGWKDIALVTKQTSDLLPALYPSVIGIKETIYDSGVELARLLIALMNGDAPANLQTLSEPVVDKSHLR